MLTSVFGNPEAYGVELSPQTKPAKREVHVTGYVTVEIVVDQWFDVDSDESDEEIKRMALEDIDFSDGMIERARLTIEGDPSARVLQRQELERERERLAAWNAGLPIKV